MLSTQLPQYTRTSALGTDQQLPSNAGCLHECDPRTQRSAPWRSIGGPNVVNPWKSNRPSPMGGRWLSPLCGTLCNSPQMVFFMGGADSWVYQINLFALKLTFEYLWIMPCFWSKKRKQMKRPKNCGSYPNCNKRWTAVDPFLLTLSSSAESRGIGINRAWRMRSTTAWNDSLNQVYASSALGH